MIRIIWRVSGQLFGSGIRLAPRRVKFVRDAVKHRAILATLMELSGFPSSAIAANPSFFTMFDAPYIHANWEAAHRLERLIDHLQTLSRLELEILGYDGLRVADLPFADGIYTIVVDRPYWFHREGVLAINLFKRNLRLFTIAFAFEEADGHLTCVVGGIQGRNIPNALDEYRAFTKFAHGLRPRDLLFNTLRYFAEAKGAVRLMCIADDTRHHRSVYFGPNTSRELPMNYDDIWLEKGGHRVDGGFFEVPIASPRRNPEEIPAKKRSMYRQRYAMIDDIRDQIWAAARNGKIEAGVEAD